MDSNDLGRHIPTFSPGLRPRDRSCCATRFDCTCIPMLRWQNLTTTRGTSSSAKHTGCCTDPPLGLCIRAHPVWFLRACQWTSSWSDEICETSGVHSCSSACCGGAGPGADEDHQFFSRSIPLAVEVHHAGSGAPVAFLRSELLFRAKATT